ncbi:hypothetical protein PUG46_07285 [Erwiniaceae bacterium L1_55_4]|nr:hypothetical protein [Erwiniaceae bacterium L1_55_4]
MIILISDANILIDMEEGDLLDARQWQALAMGYCLRAVRQIRELVGGIFSAHGR